MSHWTTPSLSNSEDVSDTHIRSKCTFQEMDFSLCHNQEDSSADVFEKRQYQLHVDQFEMLQHYATLNGEKTLQESGKCRHQPQKYETAFLFKRSYLQTSDNEVTRSPEYLHQNHLQDQFKKHLGGEAITLGSKAGEVKDVRSFDNVNGAIMLEEDGSGTHQQIAVDNIRSMTLSQEDGSSDDLLVAAEAFRHTTVQGEGEILHPQSSASPCGLGEFTNSDILSIPSYL